MLTACWFKLALFCLGTFLASVALAVEPAETAKNLCRSGGGDWTRCVSVVVANATDRDYVETPITIPIAGTAGSPVEGALPFSDELAQSLRVADADGVEYIFNVVRADGSFVDKGLIGENCALTLPATVKIGGEQRFYIFAGNKLAYPNLDRLDEFQRTATNLDFENGASDTPDGWVFDRSTSTGKLTWTDESPASGAKCVRCDVEPNSPSPWIAARQVAVTIRGGEKYRFEAKVRGQNILGQAGWYLHVGNRENDMLLSPMLYAPKKPNFDWTTVSTEFVAPANATRLDFGTVLYGTGAAWFDSAALYRVDGDGNAHPYGAYVASPGVTVEAETALSVPPSVYPTLDPSTTSGAPTFDPKTLEVVEGKRYALVRVDAPASDGERLISLDLRVLANRWGRTLELDDFDVLGLDGKPVEKQLFDDAVFFVTKVVPNARNYFVVMEKTNPTASRGPTVPFELGQNVANQAFPGTTLQSTNAENAIDFKPVEKTSGSLELPDFIKQRNLLSDGDFESVDAKTLVEPAASDGKTWTHDDPEPYVRYSIVDPCALALGAKALKVEVGDKAPLKWRGWRRTVAIEPNRSYCVGYAVKTDTESGNYDMFMHWRKANGELATAGMGSLGKPVAGMTDWTIRRSTVRSSNDAELVELHLTNQSHGTVEYDSVFIAQIDEAQLVGFYGGQTGVFQVPSVAKVFTDTTFAASEINLAKPVDPESKEQAPHAFCALALNEEETIQLAIRADADVKYTISAPAPLVENPYDVGPAAPEVFAVGNVLVDYPTNYYQDKEAATKRKFPHSSPSCDGWIGYWPDPLLPVSTSAQPKPRDPRATACDSLDPSFWNDSQRAAKDGLSGAVSVEKDKTRAIWLRFKTTKETLPGAYNGTVTLSGSDGSSLVVPYTIDVLNFTAPQTKVTGVYDARISKDLFGPGPREEKLRQVADKLLERKLSPDQPVASPIITYDAKSGKAYADWTAYDEAMTHYFDEMGGKTSYFPGDFYLFGWGNPPKEVEGEKPYPGEWPYDGADRAKLRSKYKQAYQAKLRLFWNHLKEKGWADKCVLYISDEPFYSKPEIITQMKALCDMIHEVDPTIPIYSSTWVYVPEWLGYLDVWGVGHYGGVSEASLKEIRGAGGRIWWTTDGQMCLDTPLCAVERLLPYTCVARGAEVYEFWGAAWYTVDPFESASHLYISQSDQPGVRYYVRYPNGDGYIFYPGEMVGRPGEILDSVRSEQAREGIEDAGWLVGLQRAIQERTSPNTVLRDEATEVLNRALYYLPLACGSGRFSTRYISDPKEFESIRLDVGLMLESLLESK